MGQDSANKSHTHSYTTPVHDGYYVQPVASGGYVHVSGVNSDTGKAGGTEAQPKNITVKVWKRVS